MRQRQFGLIDILDELPSQNRGNDQQCRPRLIDAENIKDAHHWYDKTSLMFYLPVQ